MLLTSAADLPILSSGVRYLFPSRYVYSEDPATFRAGVGKPRAAATFDSSHDFGISQFEKGKNVLLLRRTLIQMYILSKFLGKQSQKNLMK
jgi:hypothetical protein